MAEQNDVGKWLNESSVANAGLGVAGLPTNFDDEARPDNDLIDDATDYRNTYYQEDATVLSNLGLPEMGKEENGERQDGEAGVFKGTPIGDGFEAVDGFAGAESGNDMYQAGLKAWAATSAMVDVAKIGLNIQKGIHLAKLDPFNFVGGLLMGWMLEHVEPLRKTLDSLAGNPDMVKAYSKSWENISKELGKVAEGWVSEVGTGTAEWVGKTGNAYRTKADSINAAIVQHAGTAESLGKINEKISDLVDGVRGIITEILNTLAGMLVEIAAILVASAGTASPALIARAVFGISGAATKMSTVLAQLASEILSVGALADDVVKTIWAAGEVEYQASMA
ncbi:hypothetical protein [Nocardia mexicana]|uniref:Type VII secretion system (Wss) protein ESAT-6 n=1 Tax=Nocardia mexicana TaxID=279262 RepID=A0A370GHX2_9NOCA|nr:hypothetical protein [Nocardia mexicana]RDI43251.1 hypothetical protein DFR68_12213 [Nocardia mexicana]